MYSASWFSARAIVRVLINLFSVFSLARGGGGGLRQIRQLLAMPAYVNRQWAGALGTYLVGVSLPSKCWVLLEYGCHNVHLADQILPRPTRASMLVPYSPVQAAKVDNLMHIYLFCWKPFITISTFSNRYHAVIQTTRSAWYNLLENYIAWELNKTLLQYNNRPGMCGNIVDIAFLNPEMSAFV